MSDLDLYLEDNRQRQLQELCEWLAIPSISTLSEHQGDMDRAARWLVERLGRIGLEHVELTETAGHPLVYADWLGAGEGAPTVLVYGHYDVQPVDPLEEWETPPFEPIVRDGPLGPAVFARGATDDKGQVWAQISAAEALLATTGRLPVNLRLLVEGEEEVGGEGIAAFVREHPERLACDVVVISDSAMMAPGRPSLDYGLRGMWACELIVRGPVRDLHSGGFGGAVHNPAQALAEIVATLHDDQGRVSVPGFYDQVRELPQSERERLARVPFGDDEALAASGVPALYGEREFTVVERIGARPTLEINGIAGGYAGEGFKTVIPREARAKISCRLVPHQDPEQVGRSVAEHLAQVTPPSVRCEVVPLFGLEATLLDPESPPMRAAAAGLRVAFGAEPVFNLGGGGIPVVSVFQQVLGAPVILMGFGLADDNAHAPNERLLLGNFYKGIRAAVGFFQELSS
jgi:acetylornithine deacetylase/succinyl-diaminopimelate desuccinylase-like protein